jgi:hypothetical protein
MNLTKDTVLDNYNLTPTEFYLSQNYPNPFSEKTTIKFCVAYKTNVKLKVFNSDVKIIETLMDEEKEAGTYEVEFDTTICHSREGGNLKAAISLPAGIYYYSLDAGDFTEIKEMVLLR